MFLFPFNLTGSSSYIKRENSPSLAIEIHTYFRCVFNVILCFNITLSVKFQKTQSMHKTPMLITLSSTVSQPYASPVPMPLPCLSYGMCLCSVFKEQHLQTSLSQCPMPEQIKINMQTMMGSITFSQALGIKAQMTRQW